MGPNRIGCPILLAFLARGWGFWLGLLSRRNSWNPLKIIRDLNVLPSCEQFSNLFRDRAADFHHQPSARLQHFTGLRYQALDDLQSLRPREYCIPRLELADFELDMFFLRFAHIGWI